MAFLHGDNLNKTNSTDDNGVLSFLDIVPIFSKWNLLTLLVTLPLFIITFLIYFFIPNLNNLFGKCLMCQVTSAICYFIFQFIFMNMNSQQKGIFFNITETCFFYGYLSNFFWINVLCFVLWQTFSDTLPTTSNKMITKNDEKKKFKKYSVYGWGLPFIVCLPCRIMRFYVSYTSRLDLEIVILRLMTLCFGSVLILVGFNTTWFLIIIWQIHKLYKQRRTLLLDKNNRGKQKERNKMFLYFKFFLIMGVIRIPELLLTVYKDVRMRDMIVNVLHIIEGVMTFVIFICKRRILHAVNNKMCPSLIIFKNIDQRDHSNDVLLLKPTASTSSTHCSGASNSDQNENKM